MCTLNPKSFCCGWSGAGRTLNANDAATSIYARGVVSPLETLNPKLKRRACYTRAGTESMAPRQHARLEEMGLLRPAALGSGVLCLNEEKV